MDLNPKYHKSFPQDINPALAFFSQLLWLGKSQDDDSTQRPSSTYNIKQHINNFRDQYLCFKVSDLFIVATARWEIKEKVSTGPASLHRCSRNIQGQEMLILTPYANESSQWGPTD